MFSRPDQPARFDFGSLGPLIRRALKTRSFVVLALMGALLTGGLAAKSRPTYQSEAVLLYQDRGAANPVAAQRDAPSPRKIGLMLQEMLFSHKLLEKLVQEFGLYKNTVARVGMVGAVDDMRKTDLRFNAREGYAFRVSFQADSPDLAQRVTERAAQLLIQSHVDARMQEAKETQRFLDSEKARVEDELRARESELALFMARHPEVVEVAGARAGASALDSPPPDTSSLGLEMQALQLRERLDQLRRGSTGSSDGSKPVVPRETVEARARLETELVAAQRELTEKQAQFTEEYPDVKRAVIRVESAKSRLRHLDESAAQAAAAPTHQVPAPSAADSAEARMVRQQLELLEKQISAVRSQRRPQARVVHDPVALGRDRAQFTELDRRARESRDHINLLESRQFQAEIQSVFASQANRADLVLADPAYKPVAPVKSPRTKIAAVGALASLFLAFAVSLAFAFRDDRLRQPADLRRFGLPMLLSEVPPPEE
jgi:polysaccharide biosynthesis transport protein